MLVVSERGVCQAFKKFREFCSMDLARTPVIPFGGPGTIIQIDESKFRRKPKVFQTKLSYRIYRCEFEVSIERAGYLFLLFQSLIVRLELGQGGGGWVHPLYFNNNATLF
jgi:hypothetical protein